MIKDCEIVFNSISDPIMILDLNNEILEANNATVSAFKLPYKELIGKKCHDIFHCLDHPPTGCPNEKLKMSQTPETNDMVVEALNGTFMVTVAPILNTQGEMVKSVHISHDISERKKMESELNTRAEAVEELNRLFVNRELKMIELKKEIEELKKNN
jgi:PAS domain S-box-containing protein